MKIVVSKEEIEKVKKYLSFMDTNPCRKCASNDGFCCGCSKRISWEESGWALRDKAMDIIGDACPGGEVIEKYCQNEISLSKLQEQRVQLNRKILMVETEQNQMRFCKIEIKEYTEIDD